MYQPLRNKYQGTAIFMALLVIAIVTAITIMWFMQTRIAVRRTQQIFLAEQALLYSSQTLDWAITQLSAPLDNNYLKKQPWPKILPRTPISNQAGFIWGELDDYQARFNLNNLNDNVTQNAFIALIMRIYPEYTLEKAVLLVHFIRTQTIATDPQTNLPVSQPFISVSELRKVPLMTSTLYLALLPYISALPKTISINLTHTNPLILRGFNQNTLGSNYESEYFLLTSHIHLLRQRLTLYTLLHKISYNNGTAIHVIWQSEGGL